MKLWPFTRKAAQNITIDQVIDRIEALYASVSGITVTPETCERAPTVKAIVQAISKRISVSPVKVYRKTQRNGRDAKRELPDHPLQRLLQRPNEWQDRTTYWLDMASQLVRYNNCYSWKGTGNTGPVRRLVPLQAGQTSPEMADNGALTYRTTINKNQPAVYPASRVFHARGAARNFIKGDSPINDVQEAIAMEIAAEKFGASFFGNGAVPLLVFKIMEGFKDFPSTEAKNDFLESIKNALSGNQRHSAFMLPKGIELADKNSYSFDMEKMQFTDARKYQRTVIAGAFGVPPHLVGDLERATYNNVEQQDSDFTINVILPYVRILEAAIERSLLTDEDRAEGVIVRFNLDAIQRADFKSQSEGLQIQRLNGVISANEWRERIGMNPIDDAEGGEDYWRPSNYELPGKNDDKADEADENANVSQLPAGN